MTQKGFKLLAIRPLKGCDKKYLKNLREGEIYKFYQDYEFKVDYAEGSEDKPHRNFSFPKDTEKDIREISRPKDLIDLYSSDGGPTINISAIVGKNGSGKSSLIELFFLSVYVMNFRKIIANNLDSGWENIKNKTIVDLLKETKTYKGTSNPNFKHLDDDRLRNELSELNKLILRIELFVEKNGVVYEIKIDSSDKKSTNWCIFSIFDGTGKYTQDEEVIKQLISSYSIALNYSLHGLNSNVSGIWLKSLFHKNDGYQTPLVINPKREVGPNIDMEIEEGLQKSRLILNILQLKEFDSIDVLNKNTVKSISFILQPDFYYSDFLPLTIESENELHLIDSIEYLPDELKNPLFYILQEFGIVNSYQEAEEYLKQTSWVNRTAICYLQSKIIKFFKNYHHVFTSKQRTFKERIQFIYQLKTHTTFKIHQTINFIKDSENRIKQYFEFQKLVNNGYGFWGSEYNAKIENFQRSERTKKYILNLNEFKKVYQPILDKESILDLLYFAPPPFLKMDIQFSGGINHTFERLSSGEKQQIFVIQTLVYHIRNIASLKETGDVVKYNSVNLLLDEIEICFHPEFQQTFINRLITILSSTFKESAIKNINILFATHSPFILSDIPSSNILRIENGKPDSDKVEETFSANIHDLLANDFFLKTGFMGEFAKVKINELIEFLSSEKMEDEQWDLVEAEKLIQIIGEPFLKQDLIELFNDKISLKNRTISTSTLDKAIEELTKLKSKLNDSNSH